MEHIKRNKFKCIECATVILLISILLISSVSADSTNTSNSAENSHSKKVSSRLENVTNLLVSNQSYEVIGKDRNTNTEIRSKGYTTNGAELLDVVIKINTSSDQNEYGNFINFLKQSGAKVKHQFNETGLVMIKTPANKIGEIANISVVEKMDFEAKYYPAKAIQPPQDTGNSWGVSRINANLLWQKGFTGEGITVAVVDTGIDEDHPALNGKVVDRIDEAPDDEDGNDPTDYDGHGTHVAGIIGASLYNGMTAQGARTYVGVAPNVKLLNAKVFHWEDAMQNLEANPWNGWIPGTIGQGGRVEHDFNSSREWNRIDKIRINLTYGVLGSESDDDINIELYDPNGILVNSSQTGVGVTPKVIEYSGNDWGLCCEKQKWKVVVIGSQVNNIIGVEPYQLDIQAWAVTASDGDIADGISWAYGASNPRADVISMSLGKEYTPIIDPALRRVDDEIRNAVQRGIPVVIAAGNEGPNPDTISFTGRINEAITVGSINQNNLISIFSSRGSGDGLFAAGYKPDVVAPGRDIPASITLHSWSGYRLNSYL